MKRESSGRLWLTQDVAKRCNVSAQAVRQWHDSGVFRADHITPGGVGVYYADRAEDWAQRREGYRKEVPQRRVAWGMVPAHQHALEIPSQYAQPPEGFVE